MGRGRGNKPPKGIPLIFGSPGIRPPVPPRDVPRRQEMLRRQEAQMEEDRRAQRDQLLPIPPSKGLPPIGGRPKPGRPIPPRVHPGRRGPDQFGPDRPIEGKPRVRPGRPMPPMGGGAHHMAEMPGNPSWERRNPNWRDDPRWQDWTDKDKKKEEKRGGRGGRDYLIRFLKGGRR